MNFLSYCKVFFTLCNKNNTYSPLEKPIILEIFPQLPILAPLLRNTIHYNYDKTSGFFNVVSFAVFVQYRANY